MRTISATWYEVWDKRGCCKLADQGYTPAEWMLMIADMTNK